MSITLTRQPESLCLLRLSAIGDISHTLPVVRTIQKNWPGTKLTWIIGKSEYSLVSDIDDIEFIVFDKKQKLAAYRDIRKQLANKHFDILLHMQMSLRASLISLLVDADIKLGFDRQRAKDLQWLFTNAKIDYKPRQHVIDSFFCFTEKLGISEHNLQWNIPIPGEATNFAEQVLPGDKPVMVISPCSSMAYRNWLIERYAAVANYAYTKHKMTIVLTGAPAAVDRQYANGIIAQAGCPIIDLVGKTDLKQMLAILKQASFILAPDSGPAHLATAVGTPVIGLYATTNPDRARPYLSAEFVINKYPEAIKLAYNKSVDDLPWGTRVRDEGTMGLISVDEVCLVLDKLVSRGKQNL
jgi:heptosyltransferase I